MIIARGKKVFLRTVQRDDLPVICSWWNNPAIMKHVRITNFYISEKEMALKYLPIWQNPEIHKYMFIFEYEERPVGEIGYSLESENPVSVSVDIKTGEPELWGMGLGSEAMTLLCTYLFEETSVSRIVATPGEWNERSLGLFRKLGFKETGRFETKPNAIYSGGIAVNLEMTKELWEEVH